MGVHQATSIQTFDINFQSQFEEEKQTKMQPDMKFTT